MTKLRALPKIAAPPLSAQALDDSYRTVFERNPTPMWVLDLDTLRFLAVNASAVAEYGYPPQKFLTLTIRDVYGESELPRFDEAMTSDAQELYTGVWVHRRHDGTLLQVEIRSTDLPFQGHRARLVHVTNVTARLQGEAARRESEQLLAAIVESSNDAILSMTLDGTILTWNASAERMYGYTADEAIGQSIYMIVPPRDRHELASSLQAVCDGAHIGPYETTRVCKDGRELAVSVAISPIVNRAGVVVGLSSTARDISQRKAMDSQLRQAHRMEALGSLAGGIAHDFNNLLTVIVGTAELAIDQLEPGNPARADIEEIRLAGYSAALLTRQLLTFSRKGIVHETVVDINAVVTHLDPLLRRVLGEDVEFVVRQRSALGGVRADQGHVEQLLMNLVVNARDAMPDGGTLTVDTEDVQLDDPFVAAHAGAAVGAFVRLSVSDTGYGMTPEVRAQIFDPFFTTKGPSKGTGLGLTTVSSIVEEAGGFMVVESEPGAGSTFTAYLPHVDDHAVRIVPSAASGVGAGTETILFVEDDSRIRGLSARGLRRHGYTVLLARHAAEAIKIAGAHSGTIELLLTDIVMPGGNGQALAKELLGSISNLKVLFTSGYTDSIATLQALRASSTHFIQKPYSPDALARKVRSVLDVSNE